MGKKQLKPAMQKYYEKEINRYKKDIEEIRVSRTNYRHENQELKEKIFELDSTIEFQSKCLREFMKQNNLTSEDIEEFVEAIKKSESSTKMLGNIMNMFGGLNY